ncbi:MAG: DHH family phosphoesterase [Anaerolineaceae bacterium]|nr:DHH family phosphoesterase [Anaerolineaceae bacterium]
MNYPIYVIGHVNPDTDSIAAAVGYSWLIRERDNIDAIAARSGVINKQTAWVLKYLDIEIPYLLTDASPRFESVARHYDTTTPSSPLKEAWVIFSKTNGIAPIVDEENIPYGLVTGKSLFRLINQLVGPNPNRRTTNLNEILELPCKDAADTSIEKFNQSIRIRDLLKKVLRAEQSEFWVVDDDGQYVGVVRQRDVLNPPRVKLILVDHNEAQQSVAALEEADLIEILDHHRLGNPQTNVPIRFTVEPVGSTSTLVTEKIAEAGLAPPPEIAALLLAGLISDTLNMISPTTTLRDHEAEKRLIRWAFSAKSKLKNETIEKYAEKVLGAGTGLGTQPASEVIRRDIKTYNSGGYKFSISQAEVSDLYELNEHQLELQDALSSFKDGHGYDFAVLMVTDVVRGSSKILIENPPAILADLPFIKNNDGTLTAEGMVSRKKQLVPAILSLLEG